jgi:hypothetical protein
MNGIKRSIDVRSDIIGFRNLVCLVGSGMELEALSREMEKAEGSFFPKTGNYRSSQHRRRWLLDTPPNRGQSTDVRNEMTCL